MGTIMGSAAGPGNGGPPAGLSPYIDYGSLASFPPPFLATGGSFLAIPLKGDLGKIERLVDETLNKVADPAHHVNAFPTVHYKPISDLVMMMTGEYKRQSSLAQNFVNSGWARETASVFWVPLGATSSDGSVRLCLLAPFVLVDNEMSLICGREDFGYAKALAQFAPEGGLGSTVKINAFGGMLGAQAQWRQLIEITAPAAPAGAVDVVVGPSNGASSSPEGIDAAVAGLVELANTTKADAVGLGAAIDEVKAFFENLMNKLARQVFLKQFRDAEDSSGACFQQVVEAPLEFSNVKVALSPYLWELTITRLDSHPIATELGLTIPPLTPAWELNHDMKLNLADVLTPPTSAITSSPMAPPAGPGGDAGPVGQVST
jgi:hypothetical protein